METATRGAPIHMILCTYCGRAFDLFAAVWCEHKVEPSKVCAHCLNCLCLHPAYPEPHFWKEPPQVFRNQGFQRLFLYYP